MKPTINDTSFGSITINGEHYNRDVMIRLSGEIRKRKKALSKAVYGTSHVISLAEAEHILEAGARRLIIGTGQFGMVELSAEASAYFLAENLPVQLLPTGEAIGAWNEAQDAVIGLFHITC